MISLDKIVGFGGTITQGLGAATAISAAYISLGLPLPATKSYVDDKIAVVVHAVGDVKNTVVEGQLRELQVQRALLRTEKSALARTIDTAPDAVKITMQRRMGEIDDSLGNLDREHSQLQDTLDKGRGAAAK